MKKDNYLFFAMKLMLCIDVMTLASNGGFISFGFDIML